MNKIRELRKAKGLTMKELGKELGLAESTVSLYERNLHEPDLETIRKLASFFSVTVDYLLGHTDSEEKDKTENAHADMRAEAKMLLENLNDEKYQAAVEYLKFLQSKK